MIKNSHTFLALASLAFADPISAKLPAPWSHQDIGKPSPPTPGPIYLQDHGNPVRYRNI